MGKAQEDYELFQTIAERLGLDENETDSFVSSSMKRLGHKVRAVWEDGDDDGKGKGSGDFFGGGSGRQSRSARGSSSRQPFGYGD